MRRSAVVLASVLLAMLILIGLLLLPRGPAPQKAYTVVEVLTGLRHQPRRWIGHTIFVYGRVVVNECFAEPDCPGLPQLLIDASVPPERFSRRYPLTRSLPIIMWSLDARQQFLRRIPLGVTLAKALFQPYTRQGVVGTYRVQIHTDPAMYNGVLVRHSVALLDGLG